MVHQYDYRERETQFSKKYQEVVEKVNDPIQIAAIQNELLGNKNASISPSKNPKSLNPNQSFVEEFEKQAIQKREKQAKALAKETFNEKGEKFAVIWNNEDFRKIHDPLGVYEKKGNYQDLAWKVFRDVNDENVFLKTLYYPRLVSEDLFSLNHYFEEQYKESCSRTRLNYVLSLLSGFGAWGLSYKFRLKKTTFIGITLISSYFAFRGLQQLSNNSLQNKLNNKASAIAQKYPEIKFSQIVYTTKPNEKIVPLY